MSDHIILFINTVSEQLNAFFIFFYYLFIHFTKQYMIFEQSYSFSENNSNENDNYLEMIYLENEIC